MERPFEIDPQLYPFESHWHDLDGSPLHYLDEGEGPAVVMLHGNPTWSFAYRNVVRELSGHCRTIVPDYPGFGFSAHPDGYGYSPAEHAQSISQLLDALGLERFFLVVQDWGGPIGMAIAADHPERIAGVVVGNSWCWGPTPSMWLFSKWIGGPVGRYLILRHNLFADSMVRSSLAADAKVGKSAGTQTAAEPDPRILEAYTAPFPDAASRLGTWVFPRAITRDRPWIRSVESRLGPLSDVPAELLWGERDPTFSKPSFDERWRRHFPNAATERIADAGHFVQEDRPDRVAAAVLRLLARTAADP